MTITTVTYRRIWQVAIPIIIGLVAQNLMVVIDTAFLGRLGEVTLGAAAIGGIYYLTFVMLGTGFTVGTQIMIGRRNGERRFRVIGRIFDHAVYMMILNGLLVFIVISLTAPHFLQWFLSSDAVLQESLTFLSYRKYGIFFGFLILCFNALYIGTTRTKILSVSTFIMATTNILLDYTLIFGNFGFPAMGIAGAAIATNIAEVVTFLFLLGWSMKNKSIRYYRMFKFWKPHLRLFKPLFKLAYPVMIQYFLAFSAWFAFFLIIEQIGETALAASNITRSIYMLLMIPVWGLGSATKTLVSNTIGEGKNDEVIPLIKKILLLGFTANLVVVIPTASAPAFLISFFTDEPLLTDATVPLLYVISIAMVAFSFGIILFSGLSGTGKTLLALRIEVITIGLYLVTATLATMAVDTSAAYVWSAEIVYFGAMGLLAWFYLKKGSWRTLQV